MFGNLLEASWECLGTFRDVRGEVGNVWGPPGGENPQEGRWRMFGTFQERATPAKICVRALLGMFGNVGSLWGPFGNPSSGSTHRAGSTP